MARIKGGYLNGTYDIPKKQPLDSRMLVTKMADLINPAIWKTNGSTTNEIGAYNGMIVAVNSDGVYNGIYYLTNRTALTADNYSAYLTALEAGEAVDSYFFMWTKLGTLEDLIAIERNLRELIGELPEGKTIMDIVTEVTVPVRLAETAHGLVIVDDALSLNLATEDSDGAMAKEDKAVLNKLKDSVSCLNEAFTWGVF